MARLNEEHRRACREKCAKAFRQKEGPEGLWKTAADQENGQRPGEMRSSLSVQSASTPIAKSALTRSGALGV